MQIIFDAAAKPQEYQSSGRDFPFPVPDSCPHPDCLVKAPMQRHGFYARNIITLTPQGITHNASTHSWPASHIILAYNKPKWYPKPVHTQANTPFAWDGALENDMIFAMVPFGLRRLRLPQFTQRRPTSIMLDEKTRENIALKKFSLVAPVINGQTDNQKEYFEKLAQKVIEMPHYGPRHYAVKTMQWWLYLYNQHGLEGLKPGYRSDKGKSRTYLIAYIDDASRLCCHASFSFKQDFVTIKDGFKDAVLKRGVPKMLYTDNAKVYRSGRLAAICASIGCALLHAEPFTPNSKGKIERFFRTVRMRFLSRLKPEEIKSLEELNLLFWQWLEEDYQRKVHSALKMSPLDYFMSQADQVKLFSDPNLLDEHFLLRAHWFAVVFKEKLYESRAEIMARGKY